MYEPEDLERGFYTDYDRFLRETDLPERFLDRAIAVEDCECMQVKSSTIILQLFEYHKNAFPRVNLESFS